MGGLLSATLLQSYKGPVLRRPKIEIITYTLDNPTLIVYNTTMKPIKTQYLINPAIPITALLVTIKITGVVAWSWWIVLSPLLFLALLMTTSIYLAAIVFFIVYVYSMPFWVPR